MRKREMGRRNDDPENPEPQIGVTTRTSRIARCPRVRRRGYLVMVTRLGQLARSTRDLLNTLAAITAITGREAGFRSLGAAWAATTTAHGRLMLTVLGRIEEFEEDLNRTCNGEGQERAKARGVRQGREPKLTEHQKREAIRRRDRHGKPVREIARGDNVSHSTISRLRSRSTTKPPLTLADDLD
jgi:DNA invertase Pin-like site-specific DNA recombinase